MVENEENKTPKQLSHKQRHTTSKNICLWKNIFLLQVFVGISEAAAVSPSWINARILQLTVYVKRKHERGFRQKYTAQDFYEADKGKMKTEVLFEIRKIRFRCSVDWNRIDACNFFFLLLLISWGAAVAVQWGTDWSKSVSAMHLSLSLSQNDFIIVWKRAKNFILCCSLSQNVFYSVLFVKDQKFSFFILLSQNVFFAVWERKKSFFFLIMIFHLWFWRKTLPMPKALRTQGLSALTSNLGLVCLVQYAW